MEIYNENMERMENPDPALGWLEESVRTVHHAAVEAVEEIWHYEVIAQYPNGGRDVHRVIDRPGAETQKAWDEEIPILIYHPYTQEELEEIRAERERPTILSRMERLEAAMQALGGRLEEMLRMTAASQTTKGGE